MSIFDLVRDYADLGVHRSGSTTQATAAEWLAGHLRARGGTVALEPVAFERFVADWSVTIDGVEVEALPLFYEATGRATSSDPLRWPAYSPAGTGPLGVTGALEAGDARPGDVVVAATRNLLGLLAVSNRVPGSGSGVHVLQVAGHHGGALADGASVHARVDARLDRATCPNVLATFGDVDSAERLTILTTPISGWFRCGGERGTGIAVALELAERLAETTPLVFLGATGHELGAFGAAEFHSMWGARAHTLLHVGANVGCDWPADDVLAAPDHSHMAARLAADPAARDGVAEAFGAIGVRVDTPARDRSQWFGEAADWLDAPQLLSFLGQNPWFHAPDDLPDVSCTAARTEAVADAFTEAALRLIGS
jgi:hypothetical protein